MTTETTEEKKSHLGRVQAKIGDTVLEFFQGRKTFTTSELMTFVTDRVGAVAPNSAYRIMYELRRQGKIDYELLSRKDSLYRVVA